MANEIISEIKGQALIVTFNRPDRGNAMNMDLAMLLFNLLKNATTDRGIRAVLLRGQGGHFMTGLDMQMYTGDVGLGTERANQLMQPYHSAIRELQAMEKPVLAAVEGAVSGPGMSFMLACDLVLAARSATFNCGFTGYAMSPDGGASFFLPRKVGAARAMELLMLSESFDAAQAEKWSLINGVVDDDRLHAEALSWLDKLVNGPTRAFGAVKSLIGRSFENNLHAQLGLEHTYWGTCSRTFDFREGMKAVVAKRDAKYTGA
ncbi:MAG: enoyl-CoA hydratase-related protein [Pseudomonadota bacterium]|nr:enoyl-CoA hydratase-related protein [Pseudomonadota bacterium]